MRPVIGITQSLDDCGRWRRGRTYGYLDTSYASAVEAAGGLPLLLPVQAEIADLVDRIDGLVLPGGDDFPPPEDRDYPDDVRFAVTPERQLAFDRGVLGAARARGLPVLGICYGMQLIALAGGGALHHYLPADSPAAGPHQLPEPDGRHEVDVAPGTRLAAILGAGAHPVNSLHHQAVAAPGRGHRVSAIAPDGVIEAIELATSGQAGEFELGVQWHPEKLATPEGHRLFEALVLACGRGPRKG